MRKVFLNLLFMLILSNLTYGQTNFKKGFVITNQNDTLNGFIDFRTDEVNSMECKFKTSENASETIYEPGKISGFRFVEEGKFYVSKTITLDSIQQTLFLEYLVQGMMNLYYLGRGNGYYFFENNDQTMISVTKKPDEIVEDGKAKPDISYKNTMSYVFRECLPVALQTSNADFNRKSMILYTKDYHDKMCDTGGKCIIFENDYKKRFTKFDFAIYTGFEVSSMKLLLNNAFYMPVMYSFSPIIGGNFEVSDPRHLKSLSLNLGLTCSAFNGVSEFSSISSDSYYKYNFSAINTVLNLGLKYTFTNLELNPGFEFNFIMSNLYNCKSTLKNEFMLSNTIQSIVKENEVFPSFSLPGLNPGIGCEFPLKNKKYIVVKLMYLYYYTPKRHKEDIPTDYLETYQLRLGYKF